MSDHELSPEQIIADEQIADEAQAAKAKELREALELAAKFPSRRIEQIEGRFSNPIEDNQD